MLEERMQQSLTVFAALERLINLMFKSINILWNIVSQVGIFGMLPDVFVRIKLWCICRQPFDVQSIPESSQQALGGRSMYRPTVQNHNNALRKMHQQLCHKPFKVLCNNVVAKNLKIQPQMSPLGRNSDCRNDRQPVSPIPTVMYGCLPSGSPATANHRLKHKATFVSKNDVMPSFFSLFLYKATCMFAIWQWLLRRVRGLDAEVSGNSNPSLSGYARRLRGRNEYQIVCGLAGQCAAKSIVRWDNHSDKLLSAKVFPMLVFAVVKVWNFVLVGCGLLTPLCHIVCMPFSIGIWQQRIHQPFGQFRTLHSLRLATLSPCVCVAPIVWLFQWVSCISLSAKGINLS